METIEAPKKKECNCGNGKKQKVDKSGWKIVFCPDCELPLFGSGKYWDVHIRPMKVPQSQIDDWIIQGHDIQYAY